MRCKGDIEQAAAESRHRYTELTAVRAAGCPRHRLLSHVFWCRCRGDRWLPCRSRIDCCMFSPRNVTVCLWWCKTWCDAVSYNWLITTMVRSAELCRFASKVEPNLRGELFDFPRPRHPAHACRASSVRAGCSSPTVDKRDIPYIVVIYASSVVTTAAPIDYLVYIYPGISYCVCVLSTRRHACVFFLPVDIQSVLSLHPVISVVS